MCVHNWPKGPGKSKLRHNSTLAGKNMNSSCSRLEIQNKNQQKIFKLYSWSWYHHQQEHTGFPWLENFSTAHNFLKTNEISYKSTSVWVESEESKLGLELSSSGNKWMDTTQLLHWTPGSIACSTNADDQKLPLTSSIIQKRKVQHSHRQVHKSVGSKYNIFSRFNHFLSVQKLNFINQGQHWHIF